MNQVFLSGVTTGRLLTRTAEGKIEQAEFSILVRSRSQNELRRKDRYVIQCGGGLAEWAAKHYEAGRLASITGHLQQNAGVAIIAREMVLGERVKKETDAGETA